MMDNNRQTLNAYFALLREKNATSEVRMQALISHVLNRHRQRPRTIRRPGTAIAVGAGAVATIVGMFWIIQLLNPEPKQHQAWEPVHTTPAVVSSPEPPNKAEPALQPAERDTADGNKHTAKAKKRPRPSTPPQVPVQIEGSRFIDLTVDELARLGTAITSDGQVKCYVRFRHYSNQYPDSATISISRYLIGRGRIATDALVREELPQGVMPLGSAPELITDGEGHRRLFDLTEKQAFPDSIQRFIDSVEMLEFAHPYSVDRLIPIVVRASTGSEASERSGTPTADDVILWYPPSPELFTALPPCLGDKLRREFETWETMKPARNQLHEKVSDKQQRILDSLEAYFIRPSLPCSGNEAQTGGPFLDIWRGTSGAVAASWILPNPTSGPALLGYHLTEPRTVTIRLHSLHGEPLRKLQEPTRMKAGVRETEILLNDLAAGLYLVVISTNQGEQSVQRISIQP